MIEFRNIDLVYNGKKIFENLSLSVSVGEKMVIQGKSGSGKSSLLSMVLGFIRPDRGEIYFDGERLDEKNVWRIRRKIAYVDQDTSLGAGKVSGLFEFVGRLKAVRGFNDSRERLEELLDFFELPDEIMEKSTEELSGGERQRLSIIIAVLLGRDVFFLDEITSALDANLKEKTAGFFLGNDKWTCLIVSHDPVWLNNGKSRVFDIERVEWKR